MAPLILFFLISFSFSVEIFSEYFEAIGDTVIAEGNVETTYNNYYIKADRVEIDRNTEEVKAYGNVYIKSLRTELEVWGSFAYLDTKNDRGYILDAEGRFREFNFKAKEIKQVEKGRYKIYEGEITTCPLTDKELYLCISQADITSERVFSVNNTLRFFNVPIFYLPFFSFPIADRKSGLLFPTIGWNKYSPFVYRQPLFIVLGKDKDITLTFDYRKNQTKGLEIEYRQVFTQEEGLNLNFWVYKEDKRGPWWSGRGLYRENRFGFLFTLNRGNLKLQLEEVSDPYFYEDTSFRNKEQTKPFTVSYISYEKFTPLYSFFTSFRAYRDLTRERNEETIQILPEIYLETTPINFKGFNFSLLTNYTNFYSKKEKSQQRLIFNPQISKSFRVWKLNNFSSITFKNQLYPDSKEDKKIFTYTFNHSIPQNFYLKLKGLRVGNLFELNYSFTPKGYKGKKFDSYDEITKENDLKLRWVGSFYKSRTLADFYLNTGYNFLSTYLFPTDNKEIKKKLLPVNFTLNFYPLENLKVSQDGIYDFNLGIFARSITRASLDYKNWSFSVSNVLYKNSKGEKTSDQLSFGITYSGDTLFSGAYFNYDRLKDKQTFTNLVFGVKGKCWQIKVDYKRRYFENKNKYINEGTLSFNLFFLETLDIPIFR